jgi:hypothetical protein
MSCFDNKTFVFFFQLEFFNKQAQLLLKHGLERMQCIYLILFSFMEECSLSRPASLLCSTACLCLTGDFGQLAYLAGYLADSSGEERFDYEI